MSKRRPEDILKDIEDSETGDAVERAMSLSREEQQKELEAAGFTEGELEAKADAWHARMQEAAVEAGKARLEAEGRATSLRPPARSGRVALLVAAVAVAAVVLALLLFPRFAKREAPVAVPSATAPPSATTGAPTPSQSAAPPDAAPQPDDKPGKK